MDDWLNACRRAPFAGLSRIRAKLRVLPRDDQGGSSSQIAAL
ncbi:hypothetical protein RTCIAT899_PB02080 (plasmid) [Rhizobium tropici CIAT 899]|nr:hypothetical protein RTCIAT899_PB02080 [Rhizobium tropici CIAT 899]